jgi:dephospho-CoA kinase
MFIIGVTGGIGCGKSTVARIASVAACRCWMRMPYRAK